MKLAELAITGGGTHSQWRKKDPKFVYEKGAYVKERHYLNMEMIFHFIAFSHHSQRAEFIKHKWALFIIQNGIVSFIFLSDFEPVNTDQVKKCNKKKNNTFN